MSKVSKFGGTSLANASQFRKAVAITKSDSARQVVVVSAPGKRYPDDDKITDICGRLHRQVTHNYQPIDTDKLIYERFDEIARGLRVSIDLRGEMDEIMTRLHSGASLDYAMSRGEYLSAKIMAKALDYAFVDAAECVRLDWNGRYGKDDQRIRAAAHERRVVIPGFYGTLPDGSLKTFSRGGSDLTGAIAACAVRADLYENWTDVSGLLMANPHIVKNPRPIRVVTFSEVRELTYMGASVFHEEAMFPVQEAGINTRILNTNAPEDEGTLMVPEGSPLHEGGLISGIAGRTRFAAITVKQMLMDKEIGFGRRLLSIVEEAGVGFEHMPGGVDHLTLVIDERQLNGKRDEIVRTIEREFPAAVVSVKSIAQVVVVGLGMVHHPGILARIALAITGAGINILTVNQGLTELSIVIGVENDDCDNAVRAIYAAFDV